MSSRYPDNEEIRLSTRGTCEVDEALNENDPTLSSRTSFAGASISATCASSDGEEVQPCPAEEGRMRYEFAHNVKNWREETGLLSSDNFSNAYFGNIVDMGEAAVPYILEELQKGPTQLVHALDLIYPDRVQYRGAVSLRKACDAWLKVLQR